ncbi:MAG: amidohydrolase family protein [Bacteroidales bacterium]
MKTETYSKLEIGYPDSILKELKDAVMAEKLPFEQVLKVVTSNVADILKLHSKGRIEPGKDADVLILNENFEICHLLASGKWMVKKGKMLRRGSYE